MSELSRDLARGAAIRAKRRAAGCPEPKCNVCGEDKVWRLAFKKGRLPLCRNCLADRTRNRDREAEIAERCRAAGFSEPRCVVCGETRFWRIELDHIAGQLHDPACAPLCCNCHADRTFMQSTQGKPSGDPRNVFEVIGRWLLGIAEWLELIIIKLYDFGEFLIGLARQGYGGDLSFAD